MAATQICAVVVAAFEPDEGPMPGELRYFIDRERLTQRLPFAAGHRPLYCGDGVLGLVCGVGAARAAASVMALGLDARFDLTRALWLITGVAGIDPERGPLGSVVLPEFVVEGALAHEIDGREIPADWPDGFVPIGKSAPYEQPLAQRFNGDDGIVFRLNAGLVREAYNATRSIELLDTPNMAVRRGQFGSAQPPSVTPGDELSSTTFWHGRMLSRRAREWVRYQTGGLATYSITAMEDSGILQSLSLLAAAGRVDFGQVVIARGASNYDQQREGVSAAESLVENRVAANSGYLPALENAWRVGARIVRDLAELPPG